LPTLTTTPATPVPNRPMKVRATATAGGSAIRIWLTDAPRGSALRKKLDESGASRIAFDPPTVQSGKDFDFTPDRGGGYVLVLDELVYDKPGGVNPNFGGAYEGDPQGAKFERIQTSASTTLYVASEFTSLLGFGQDRATLHLHIANDAIVPLRKDVHGVVSPRIDLPSQPSARARLAAESQEVRFALSLLVNNSADEYPASRILGDLPGIIDTLIANVNHHLRGTGNHAESASSEQIGDEFLHATSTVGILAALNKIRNVLDRHVRNDSGEGTGSAGWHNSGNDAGIVSWESVPVVAPTEQAIDASLADLVRCLRIHELSEVHNEVGGPSPNLFQLSILTWLHEQFIQQVVSRTPTAPANSNPLGAEFVARGFTETA
jgi:hypothetical protein